MEIGRIAHAGVVVAAEGVRCLMDPVLVQPFECGANAFEPAICIDPAHAAECDFVILSHEHGDHFSLPSLDLIRRDRPVFFPEGAGLIEDALTALGFHDRRQVTPGTTFGIGPFELTFTASDVAFAEMGVLFGNAGSYAWNCVDCELGDRAFDTVAARTVKLDIMLAAYQSLVEEPLGQGALGADFPLDRHRRNLEAVRRAAPRCVIPSSCGYRYTTAEWQNARGFPVSEEEFLADLALLEPHISGRSLLPGSTIDVETLSVREAGLPFVRLLPERPVIEPRSWRPDLGVDTLRDDDPFRHGTGELRAMVECYLHGRFFTDIASPLHHDWRARLTRAAALWRLEIVYPDGPADVRWLDFAGEAPMWDREATRVPKLGTTICASTIAGLLNGEVTPYRALFTRRVALKLYGVREGRIEWLGSLADEPIGRLLFEPAVRLNIDHELARLGYRRAGRGVRGVRSLPGRLRV